MAILPDGTCNMMIIVSYQHPPPIEICFRITMKTCFSWYFYGVVHFESEFVMSQSKHLLITKSNQKCQKCWRIRLLIFVVVSRKTGEFCDRLQLQISYYCYTPKRHGHSHTEAIIVATHCQDDGETSPALSAMTVQGSGVGIFMNPHTASWWAYL